MLSRISFMGKNISSECRTMRIEPPIDNPMNITSIGKAEIEDTPPNGARVTIAYAGLCYHNFDSKPQPLTRASEYCSKFSGYKDAALYSGFEVSGVIDEIGAELSKTSALKVGQRVVIYPSDDLLDTYVEVFNVSDPSTIIPIPDNLGLPMAAMLPTGGLIAMNTIEKTFDHLKEIRKTKKDKILKIFIIGTGNLALWAAKTAIYFRKKQNENVELFVASLRDEGYLMALDLFKDLPVKLIQWYEDLPEGQLIERARNACKGPADVIIDFGTTTRHLNRCLQCLEEEGFVMINRDVSRILIPKFAAEALKKKIHIEPIQIGTVEQLQLLVKLVADNEIVPPPFLIFPFENAATAITQILGSEIPGHAIMEFNDIV